MLVETFALLFSSITYGMAMIAMNKGNKSQVNTLLGVTFLFGLVFIGMEIYEFHHLIAEGYTRSQRVPVCLLRTGRHPRAARNGRSDLVGHHDDSGVQAWPDCNQ